MFILALLALRLYAVAAGAYELTLGHPECNPRPVGGIPEHRLWDIRIPRIIAAIVVGWRLGLCGAVMQCLLKNPFASPFTLGISQCADLGSAFAIVVLGAVIDEISAGHTTAVQTTSAAGRMQTGRSFHSSKLLEPECVDWVQPRSLHCREKTGDDAR
ncbi:MAG: iron chelate uptake ABC transporter family permease subunit [Desulfomonilaceae bacterium]